MVSINKVYFSRVEFKCKCGRCDCDTVDSALLEILCEVREEFGRIAVTSGHRCEAHNEKVGGAPNSQHLYGRAADIVALEHLAQEDVAAWVREKFPLASVGVYQTFTHIDTRTDGPKLWWDK